jgi:phospholipid/cholesterol/gamma-HCH transport system permease protein
MTEPLSGRGWLARIDGTNMVLFLSGDWTAHDDVSRMYVTDSLLQRSNIHALRFDSSNLGRWDSSLLVLLSSLREASRRRHIVFDQTGLPPAARRLLALFPAAPPESVVPVRNVGTAERVGIRAIGIWSDLIGITTLIGETIHTRVGKRSGHQITDV